MTTPTPQPLARDYSWRRTHDALPDISLIVWISAGGGTALLACHTGSEWVSATNDRPLPFVPVYWQHLRLPEWPDQPPAPHPILETMSAPEEGFEWTLIPGENPNRHASWKQRPKQPPSLIRRFRKKPVVIEAIQFTAEHLDECVAFCGGEYEYRTASQCAPFGEVLHIKTLEGTMTAVLGDWIIKGVKGEFYPCKPDIMGATYESTDLAPTPNVSETPRTDAAIVESILCTEGGDEECTVYPCVEHVESDFARQLERELTAYQKWVSELRVANLEVQGAISRVTTQLTAALARAEKAEEDTRRLDWLMGNIQWHTPSTMYGEVREYRFRTPITTPTINIRKAIDAALTPTKEPAP